MGLLNQVVPADQLMDTAYDYAERIAANAPLAVSATKQSAVEGLALDLERLTTTRPGTATGFSRPRTPRKDRAPSPRSGRRGGRPAELSTASRRADVATDQRQHPAHDRQQDGGPDRGPPEVVDLQSPVGGVFGDPGGDPQHERVDDDMEKAKRQDVQRDRQDLHDRFDERVDQTEDHRDDEDDADPLQLRVAADKAQPVDEQGDDPQGKSGQCGAQQKRTHAEILPSQSGSARLQFRL